MVSSLEATSPSTADNGRNSLLISVFTPKELSKDASFSLQCGWTFYMV